MSRTFDQAVWLHQQGLLEEAAALYQAALKADPRHVGSLHRLSVLRRQQGRIEESLALGKHPEPFAADAEQAFHLTPLERLRALRNFFAVAWKSVSVNSAPS